MLGSQVNQVERQEAFLEGGVLLCSGALCYYFCSICVVSSALCGFSFSAGSEAR